MSSHENYPDEGEIAHSAEQSDLDGLLRYEVKIKTKGFDSTWSIMVEAENFAHAEEQALPYVDHSDQQIVSISKDYVN